MRCRTGADDVYIKVLQRLLFDFVKPDAVLEILVES